VLVLADTGFQRLRFQRCKFFMTPALSVPNIPRLVSAPVRQLVFLAAIDAAMR